MVNTDWYYIEI